MARHWPQTKQFSVTLTRFSSAHIFPSQPTVGASSGTKTCKRIAVYAHHMLHASCVLPSPLLQLRPTLEQDICAAKRYSGLDLADEVEGILTHSVYPSLPAQRNVDG